MNYALVMITIGLALSTNCRANGKEWVSDKLTFPVNNEESEQFGYLPPTNSGPGVGPQSIILHGRYAYVADAVHGNVKRIDLITRAVKVSPDLATPARLAWPTDIAVMKSRVYVASSVDRLHILDEDLTLLDTKQLLPGNDPFFLYVSEDSLILYQTVGENLWVIYSPDSLVLSRDTTLVVDWFAPHGRSYSLIKDSLSQMIETCFYTLKLDGAFPLIFDKLDAINIDFNDSTLVYFDIDETRFELHVYTRAW